MIHDISTTNQAYRMAICCMLQVPMNSIGDVCKTGDTEELEVNLKNACDQYGLSRIVTKMSDADEALALTQDSFAVMDIHDHNDNVFSVVAVDGQMYLKDRLHMPRSQIKSVRLTSFQNTRTLQ